MGAAVGLLPLLNVPAAASGDGGQLGLGVHCYREAHRFQHREVARRVGVGHGLLEAQSLGLGEVAEHQGPGFADGRELFEPAGELAVLLAQPGADDVVEQGAQRLDHQIESSGDQEGAVAERPVPAHPGDAGGKGLGQQQAVEELPPVVPQPVDRGTLVAAVEGAEEVAAVPTVECQERRGLCHEVGHERRPFRRGQMTGGQPGVGVDHVGRDEGVLEVEGGQMPVGGEDGLAGPVGPVGPLEWSVPGWSAPGRAR